VAFLTESEGEQEKMAQGGGNHSPRGGSTLAREIEKAKKSLGGRPLNKKRINSWPMRSVEVPILEPISGTFRGVRRKKEDGGKGKSKNPQCLNSAGIQGGSRVGERKIQNRSIAKARERSQPFRKN